MADGGPRDGRRFTHKVPAKNIRDDAQAPTHAGVSGKDETILALIHVVIHQRIRQPIPGGACRMFTILFRTLALLALLSMAAPALAAPPRTKGACCKPDGSCKLMTRNTCLKIKGSFRGLGKACSPTLWNRVGACAFSSGACAIRTAAACRQEGGQFHGNTTTCTTINRGGPGNGGGGNPGDDWGAGGGGGGGNPGGGTPDNPTDGNGGVGGGNPNARGACCLIQNNSCSLMTVLICAQVGGEHLGAGTSCTSVACRAPTGAWCSPIGICAFLSAYNCLAEGGSYNGDYTTCVTVNCPAGEGACRLPSGACVLLSMATCNQWGGVWRGGGTTCTDEPELLGA